MTNAQNTDYERDLAERQARTDLCDECIDPDHNTCSMNPSCACCLTTIEALVDEGAHIDSSGADS